METRKSSAALGWFLLLLLVFAYAMAFQGSRAPWERDEGRDTRMALEMLKSGDWYDQRETLDMEIYDRSEKRLDVVREDRSGDLEDEVARHQTKVVRIATWKKYRIYRFQPEGIHAGSG